MKRGRLRRLVQNVLEELREENALGVGGSTFNPGQGAQYAAPFRMKKKKK